MRKLISQYKTLIFDCDGVVLNSNKIKIEAFYKSALPYGSKSAQELVDYHIANGGISRYHKFDYFLKEIVPNRSSKQGPNIKKLLKSYSEYVIDGLLSCDIAPGLQELRNQTSKSKWLIVSGGDQEELRYVFKKRDITNLFNGGIFGSPETKEVILAREMRSGNIRNPSIFLGDSKYDHQVAMKFQLDFLFLSGWSDVANWKDWTSLNEISYTERLQELSMLSPE